MFRLAQKLIRRVRSEQESGFTLIELLIVIIVLGILAGIIVFALGGVTKNTAQAACNTDAKNVETAVVAYNAQTGSYPTGPTGQQLVPTYIRTWPSTTHYAVTITGVSGEVDVAAPSTATPANFDGGSACTNAS